LVGLAWGSAVEGIGAVSGGVQWNKHLSSAIAVIVVPSVTRLIDGELFEVGTAVSVDLRVEV
jgi:hypothetical protein